MGYQESYFTVAQRVNSTNFTSNNVELDELIEVIRNNGYDAYRNIGCRPVEIITLGENVCDYYGRMWNKGTKFVYFVGERFPQSHGADELGNILLHPECNTCRYFRGQKVLSGGECGPWSCRKKNCKHKFDGPIDVIFTEDMPCESIWADAGGVVTAKHDSFWGE